MVGRYRRPNKGYSSCATVTKSNTVDITDANGNTKLPDALFIGGAGTMTIVMGDGSSATLTVVAGQILEDMGIKRVMNSGTATLIVAFFR